MQLAAAGHEPAAARVGPTAGPTADPSHDVCNAREHGLVGNGQVDDQPALAALVEKLGRACAQDGRPRVIYCPPGEYLIADTTFWKSGVSLIGAAPGATRFILSAAEAISLARFTEAQDGASSQYPLVDCTFKLFEIDGSRVQLGQYQPRAKGLDLQYRARTCTSPTAASAATAPSTRYLGT